MNFTRDLKTKTKKKTIYLINNILLVSSSKLISFYYFCYSYLSYYQGNELYWYKIFIRKLYSTRLGHIKIHEDIPYPKLYVKKITTQNSSFGYQTAGYLFTPFFFATK